MISDFSSDAFDVFDPWTLPTESPTVPAPGVPEVGTPAAEAPAPDAPARPTRPQPMPIPFPAAFDAPEPAEAEATDPKPEPATPRARPAADARFAPSGALEPGVVVASAATEAKRARWSEGRPAKPAAPPALPPDPATRPADFLRKVVVPEFQSLARRLEASQHYTTVQDLLDLPAPAVRVLIWPRPGLLDQAGARILATFELVLDRSDPARVTTSYWLGARPEHVIPMAELPVSKLEMGWIDTQVLDFVQKVLDRM